MRTEVEIERVRPSRDRAVVELAERDDTTESGLVLVRLRDETKYYQPEDDYEIGIIRALGDGGGWEPAEVGDTVMIRARSGGAAGADIGQAMNRDRGEVVVVERDEIVAVIG